MAANHEVVVVAAALQCALIAEIKLNYEDIAV